MKKLLLLCGIIMYSMFGYAQITLTPTPGTIGAPTPGSSVPISVHANGETHSTYITSVSYTSHANSASPSSSQFDALPITSVSYYSPVGGGATVFTLNVTALSSITQSYTVTYYIGIGSSDHSINFLSFSIIINPLPFGNAYNPGPFTKNDCGPGYTGTTVAHTIAANTYFGTTQAAANAAAQTAGQNFANAPGNGGSCCPTGQISSTILKLANGTNGPTIYVNCNVAITQGTYTIYMTYLGSPSSYTVTRTSSNTGNLNYDDSPVFTDAGGGYTTVSQEIYFPDYFHTGATFTFNLQNACGTTYHYAFSFHE